jgi:hypothetical protein
MKKINLDGLRRLIVETIEEELDEAKKKVEEVDEEGPLENPEQDVSVHPKDAADNLDAMAASQSTPTVDVKSIMSQYDSSRDILERALTTGGRVGIDTATGLLKSLQKLVSGQE